MKKLVVVGNGMVGFKLCEKLRRKVGVEDLEITVYGDDHAPQQQGCAEEDAA